MKKIPHAQGVARALRQVHAAAKKALKGLNRIAAERMKKGDYSNAEALAGKGREIRQFQDQIDQLGSTWRALSGRAVGGASGVKAETTPLWGYYQPILKTLAALGGQGTHEDVEAALAPSAGMFFKSGDRVSTSSGWERWQNMVYRAWKPLKAEGWVETGPGKTWRLTDAGRKAIEDSAMTKR